MRPRTLAPLLLLALAVPLQGQCASLLTQTTGGTGQKGCLFDVQNVSAAPLTIVTFEQQFLSAGTADLEIYTKSGTWMGSQATPAAWTLAGSLNGLRHPGVSSGPVPTGIDVNVTIPPGATQAFYITATQATGSNLSSTPGVNQVGAVLANDGTLSVLGGVGIGYPFGTVLGGPTSGRLWNGRVHYVTGGFIAYQTNRAEASFSVQGAVPATRCTPSHRAYCFNSPVALDFASSRVGSGYELAIAFGPTVPAGGGGVATPAGQVINLPVPTVLYWWNGLTFFPLFVPFPGSFTTMFDSGSVAFTASAQMFVLDPAISDGYHLSQAAQIDVVPTNPGPIPGPAGEDASLAIPLGQPPDCLPVVSLYGTAFTTMHVIANGRVMFGSSGDTDFSPTVAEALLDNPFVGAWCDLSPNATTALVSVTSPAAGILRVDWSNVPYFGQPLLTTNFGVELDSATGEVQIDGIQTFPVYPATPGAVTDMFLGISGGSLVGATDPGPTTFAPPGVMGMTANATDMIYRFGTAGTLAPGVSRIRFLPNPAGNYDFVTF